MPVKHGLLSLLAEGPSHGYQLKAQFEARTGGSWQLNIGQVYTTLSRLERDGLVTALSSGSDDRREYAITAEGRRVLADWFRSPLIAEPPPRDELAIKVLLAMASPDVDVHAVVLRQRTATLEHLQALTRRKQTADPHTDLSQVLHLDALILRADAESRWLDLCEARLAQIRPSVATEPTHHVPPADPTGPTDPTGSTHQPDPADAPAAHGPTRKSR